MHTKTRKVRTPTYFPKKYFTGLSKGRAATRRREIRKFGSLGWRNPAAYKGFKTDIGVKSKPSGYSRRRKPMTLVATRSSHYTDKWTRRFPRAKSLQQKAAATGVPLRYIRESYNRGMAAWRTGHRPGATQQQWGYARVHSFLLCGKTYRTTDSDLARKAKASSAKARAWWSKAC
jgi:hypothetical protein